MQTGRIPQSLEKVSLPAAGLNVRLEQRNILFFNYFSVLSSNNFWSWTKPER
jgi:hypothetical protein